MPKGNPTKHTIASEKYQKKAGYMVKGFKIKKEVAEIFEEACKRNGVSQASVITQFMIDYSQNTKRG